MASCLWWKFNIHIQCPGTEVLYNPLKNEHKTGQNASLKWQHGVEFQFFSLVNQGKPGVSWKVLTQWCFSIPLVCRASPHHPAGPWKERLLLLLLQCFSCPALSAAVWDPSGPPGHDEVHNLVLHLHCGNSDTGSWGQWGDFQHRSIC